MHGMANDIEHRGDILAEWSFPETERHERSRWWYLSAAALFLIAIAIALFARNYTFTAFLLVAGLVLLVQLRRPPLNVACRIRESGIEVGRNYYKWEELKEFWILYKPPTLKKLYLDFKNALRPLLDISLVDENPVHLRQLLSQHLLENTKREEEPASDQISRFLKI